jgi:hypothetical protein
MPESAPRSSSPRADRSLNSGIPEQDPLTVDAPAVDRVSFPRDDRVVSIDHDEMRFEPRTEPRRPGSVAPTAFTTVDDPRDRPIGWIAVKDRIETDARAGGRRWLAG